MPILLFVMWAALIISFFIKDFGVLALTSFMFIFWGIKVLTEGLLGVQDWFTEAISWSHIFIGLIVFIRGSYELYKDW